MRNWPLAIVVLAAVFSSAVRSVRSEVIHGSQVLHPYYIDGLPMPIWTDGFDFSNQAIVHYLSDAADLTYQEKLKYPNTWEFFTGNLTGIVRSNTALEDIQQAPSQGYGHVEAVTVGQTYLIKTGDGLYAKFRVQGFDMDGYCCSITMEYYVQMDGSPNFGPLLAVESTTWGRVKALYR